MTCKRPYYNNGIAHGCGQCLPCRINRRRLWTHRILLESYSHEFNSFITLTYDEENCPRTESGLLTLEPKDVQDWLKKLRKRVEPRKVRYYLTGEYGEQTFRPHYHLALFNYPPCIHGRPQVVKDEGCPCNNCQIIAETWNKGFTYNGELSKDSASYIAQYVTKSLTKFDDPSLQGRYPEFARMSNRPGIGAESIKTVANSLRNIHGDKYLATHGDVPSTLNHGGNKLPLGRYLTNQLRKELGREEGCPDEKLNELIQNRKDLEWATVGAGLNYKKRAQILGQTQKIANIETKYEIFKKGKKI